MVVIERTASFVTTVLDRVFYPGSTVLTDEEFKRIRGHRGFTTEVEAHHMKVLREIPSDKEPAGDSPEEQAANEISSLKVADALRVVSGILDITVLQKILEVEKRQRIREIAERQVAMLREDRKEENPDGDST